MTKKISGAFRLNNQIDIPYFGLGVWSSQKGSETQNAVLDALECGYRHIDTAAAYGNEEDVGIGVKKSGIPREQIFITTKLGRNQMGYNETLRAFDSSEKKLGTHIDLYLIHWPSQATRADSWRAMESLYEDKRVRAIGVSNYTQKHLEELLGKARIKPVVNQVEMSPFLYQKELIQFCHQNEILVEAYSPLTRGEKFGHPVLVELASKYQRSPSQILIRWCIEHDLIVFPKSVKKSRIQENSQVFDFSIEEEDMKKLDSLDENFRCNPSWNPELEP